MQDWGTSMNICFGLNNGYTCKNTFKKMKEYSAIKSVSKELAYIYFWYLLQTTNKHWLRNNRTESKQCNHLSIKKQ